MFEINDIASDALFYSKKGWFYLFESKYALAQEQFERALEQDSLCINALMGAGTVSWACTNFEGALYFFTRVLTLDPNFSEAYSSRGAIFATMRDYSEALADFNTCIRINESCASGYVNRATLNISFQSYEAALKDLDRALAIELCPAVLIKKAYTNFLLNNFEETIEACTYAVALQPDAACAYYLRGLSHYNTGDYQAALADFDLSLNLIPGAADVYHARACAYQFLMEFELAAQNMQRAAHLDERFKELADKLSSSQNCVVSLAAMPPQLWAQIA
ncbi:MAG: tetratricopeptide repeat protein [Cyanobacteria bacterium SZAS-4]|nr:tetratricopeptide repeat protein [Cyanobacteria bacterium SZAS-4]